jgi:hypothetical protein
MILDYISFPAFIVSLAIGLLFVYAIGTDKKKIYIYPSPENIDKILFKDKAENCFSFQQQEVDCKNAGEISFIPIQA